eukprot:6196746-Pleurochrysis_carterae.AAC.1
MPLALVAAALFCRLSSRAASPPRSSSRAKSSRGDNIGISEEELACGIRTSCTRRRMHAPARANACARGPVVALARGSACDREHTSTRPRTSARAH